MLRNNKEFVVHRKKGPKCTSWVLLVLSGIWRLSLHKPAEEAAGAAAGADIF